MYHGKGLLVEVDQQLVDGSECVEDWQFDLKEGTGLQKRHPADVSALFLGAGRMAFAFTGTANALV